MCIMIGDVNKLIGLCLISLHSRFSWLEALLKSSTKWIVKTFCHLSFWYFIIRMANSFFKILLCYSLLFWNSVLDKNVLAILDLTPRGTGFMGAGNEGPSNQENANDNDSESNRNLQIWWLLNDMVDKNSMRT